jgi:DNA (cytosine-5)-methyltransferase 1
VKRVRQLVYGSVCSGIEAATVAWHALGMRPAWFAEIDAFPSAVLAQRFPAVPNLGDMKQLGRSEVFKREPIDVLVGGTPCQSFSVAGLRGGLDDPRGNLALVFLEIARRKRPRWLVWENVPGVLSSGEGRDFGAFLGTLAKLGYGWAYRVLDAQHFGVPQRRRRVFVVGHLGGWRRAAAVLFERESLSGNPAPRQAARQGVAALTAAGVGTCGADDNQAQAGHLIARALSAKGGSGRSDGDSETFVTHALRAEGFDASEDGTGRGTPLVPIAFSSKDHGADAGRTAPTLRAGAHSKSHANAGVPPAVVINGRQDPIYGKTAQPLDTDPGSQAIVFESRFARNGRGAPSRLVPPLKAQSGVTGKGDSAPLVAWKECQSGTRAARVHATLDANKGSRRMEGVTDGMVVRRLTPRECERLQGFPDDFTLIPWRGKAAADCPDGPRYKALGNSMAVPVMRWLGERIQRAEAVFAGFRR